MKAVVIDQFGHTENLHLVDRPIPQPEEDEVQIQILYTSVNPVDWKLCEGLLQGRLPHEFPITPGWDASGIVTEVGLNVKNLHVGDEVYAYCRKPIIHDGTYAEYICFDAENVALKPKNLSFAEAAAIPLVGLSAWQALFDTAKLKKGETILVQAGAGGVGSLAIALAKNTGARIYTTASKDHHEYVKNLGADVPIDYTSESFVDVLKKLEPHGIDVVLECIGGEVLKTSANVLKSGGRLVSILGQLDPKIAKKKNIDFSYLFVAPNGTQLQQIASLIEQERLPIPHIEEMTLDQAAEAHEKVRQGHTQGKIVLKIK
ncbi:MAG: NADP-dependent oxidoreductase [Parachlamydia sp.]|nr:NADP-dependent oxidoreductase [Parachlamydia sp.]